MQYEKIIRFIIAIIAQATIFSIYFFIDARMTMADTAKSILRFGARPLTVLFFGLSPIIVWLSYREVRVQTGSFWVAAFIQGFVLQIVFIVSSYLGSRQKPSIGEIAGLTLGLLAVVLSSILNKYT